jgi:hypothetical protein
MFSISYIASAEVRYKLKTNIQLSAVKRTPIELIWMQPVLRNKLSVKSHNEINKKLYAKAKGL